MDHSEARSSDGSATKGIAEWLESIGLGEYARRFADNAIDLSTLRNLTDQDLMELGVLLGHRRKMLRAIAELGATTVIAPAAPAAEPEQASPDGYVLRPRRLDCTVHAFGPRRYVAGDSVLSRLHR